MQTLSFFLFFCIKKDFFSQFPIEETQQNNTVHFKYRNNITFSFSLNANRNPKPTLNLFRPISSYHKSYKDSNIETIFNSHSQPKTHQTIMKEPWWSHNLQIQNPKSTMIKKNKHKSMNSYLKLTDLNPLRRKTMGKNQFQASPISEPFVQNNNVGFQKIRRNLSNYTKIQTFQKIPK